MSTLFQQLFIEAPEEAPDLPDVTQPTDPPDMSMSDDTAAPDMNDPPSMDDSPDIGDMSSPDMGDGSDEYNMGDSNQEQPSQELNIDEKISAIMNQRLYQKFLTLLNTINVQLSVIKNNSDIFATLSPDVETIESLKRLDENIRLYLNNQFQDESYSQNLLFYNKCLNLLKMLIDIFDKKIRKGMRAIE